MTIIEIKKQLKRISTLAQSEAFWLHEDDDLNALDLGIICHMLRSLEDIKRAIEQDQLVKEMGCPDCNTENE
jgi:hypothetical protein